jgi:CO/xanthine dehydrogenase Mo-binding subunit
LAAVAAKAHAQNGVVAAMAHGFNRWSWSLCGTTVRVAIERASGALQIAKAYSVLECGQALAPL